MILLLLACAPKPAPVAEITWDGWAHGFFVSYCGACHSATTPDRHGAPESVTFDTEEEAIAQASAIRAAVLDNGTMPIAAGVFPEDLERLRVWVEGVGG